MDRMDRTDDGSRDRGADHDASTHDDEVRRRAYDLYMARGGAGGSEMDDWLAAEREVRGQRADIADRPQSTGGNDAVSAAGRTPGGRGVPADAPRSADEARSANESRSAAGGDASDTDSSTLSGMEGVVADERDTGTSAKTSRAPRTRSGRGRRAD